MAAIEVVLRTDISQCSAHGLDVVQSALQRLRGHVEHRTAAVAERRDVLLGLVDDTTTDPEPADAPPPDPTATAEPSLDLADVGGNDDRRTPAEKRTDARRAKVRSLFPPFDHALAEGRISGAHLDVLHARLRDIDRLGADLADEVRTAFLRVADELLEAALHEHRNDFVRTSIRILDRVHDHVGVNRRLRLVARAGVRTWWDDDGMLQLRAELDPETGAAVLHALDSALEYASNRPHPGVRFTRLVVNSFADVVVAGAAAVRRGAGATGTVPAPDATGSMAERATAQPSSGGIGESPSDAPDHVETGDTSNSGNSGNSGDTETAGGSDASNRARPRRRRDRAGSGTPGRGEIDLIVVTDVPTLLGGHDGLRETSAGAELSAAALERLSCDAAIRTVLLGADGAPMAVGHRRRLAGPALRAAVTARHRTCVHPECDVRVDRCRLHHAVHWARGGLTVLANLVPVCDAHHVLVHDLGWHIRIERDRTATWIDQHGEIRFRSRPDRSWTSAPDRR